MSSHVQKPTVGTVGTRLIRLVLHRESKHMPKTLHGRRLGVLRILAAFIAPRRRLLEELYFQSCDAQPGMSITPQLRFLVAWDANIDFVLRRVQTRLQHTDPSCA